MMRQRTYSIDSWFDVAGVSELAHRERSAFKPVYTVNRYWARRSSSVFRSILVGLLSAKDEPTADDIYRNLVADCDVASNALVLDPFMGGGTTVIESLRAGCRVVGVDLNPLSKFVVEVASTKLDLDALSASYDRVRSAVAPLISDLYSTTCPCCGSDAEVVHTFWSKQAECQACGNVNDLRREMVVGRRRNAVKVPVRLQRCRDCGADQQAPVSVSLTHELSNRDVAICRACGSTAMDSEPTSKTTLIDVFAVQCPECDLVESLYGPLPTKHTCAGCDSIFALEPKRVGRGSFVCSCGESNSISAVAQAGSGPLAFRPYAIEGYCPRCAETACSSCQYTGRRFFKPLDSSDLERLDRASLAWQLRCHGLPWPREAINDYEKTNRLVVNGYERWSELFNERQLLVLASILAEIRKEPRGAERTALTAVLLGTLEHQNMLNIYYLPYAQSAGAFGRHDFHPKVTACEGNVWGGAKGRGTFRLAFAALAEAQAYLDKPWDARHRNGKRERVRTGEVLAPVHGSAEEVLSEQAQVSLLTQDSRSLTQLPSGSIDHIITDPPYADAVQYAELADFFLVWLRAALGDVRPEYDQVEAPKTEEIVQNERRELTATDFYDGLTAVFAECHRVLKSSGRLVFTFHHSRRDNWVRLHDVLKRARFELVASYPVASEGTRSGNLVFHTNKGGIAYDIIHVCRKRPRGSTVPKVPLADVEFRVRQRTEAHLRGILSNADHGQRALLGDVTIMLWADVLAEFGGSDRVVDEEGQTASLEQALDWAEAVASEVLESVDSDVRSRLTNV